MDFNADGILDFISGSYDPGDLYFFRGLGGGKYAVVEKLRDKAGTPLVHHPRELIKYHRLKDDPGADSDEKIQARVASFGSWPAAVDWEQDGDLDMLIGTFSGQLFLRLNEGTREKPSYSTESVPVEAGGKPFKVNGHAAPVIADWDGDGLWDLVVSASDGSVGWYRNHGAKTEPKFKAGETLVEAKASSKFLFQFLTTDEIPTPGVRTQICVVDYDLDGDLDLILGDYRDGVHRPKANLGQAELAEWRKLIEKQRGEKDEAALREIQTGLRRLADEGRGRQSFIWLYERE